MKWIVCYKYSLTPISGREAEDKVHSVAFGFETHLEAQLFDNFFADRLQSCGLVEVDSEVLQIQSVTTETDTYELANQLAEIAREELRKKPVSIAR